MDPIADADVDILLKSDDVLSAVAQTKRSGRVQLLEDLVMALQRHEHDQFGGTLHYREARASLKRFIASAEQLGLITFRVGRRGKPSRIVWKADVDELIRQVAKKSWQLRDVLASASEANAASTAPSMAASPSVPDDEAPPLHKSAYSEGSPNGSVTDRLARAATTTVLTETTRLAIEQIATEFAREVLQEPVFREALRQEAIRAARAISDALRTRGTHSP